ncbi:MAG TPA: hypothetical protein VJ875_00075 [Pyrinomonadaceae bacterium]|nr:hypothetical protein [Pyrinomonadaceae bacterium]
MSDADNEIDPVKVSDTISTETAMLAVSLVLFVQQNQDLMQFMVHFLAGNPSGLPVPDNLKERLEAPLKQAAELLVGAQVLNGFVRYRTPERAVTFVYIAFRYILYAGKKPTRAQSRDLWQRVWVTARQFPIVAHEYEQREQAGDLKDWVNEVQATARRQLRTFKDRLPKIQKSIAGIYSKAYKTFLGEA